MASVWPVGRDKKELRKRQRKVENRDAKNPVFPEQNFSG